MASKIIGITVDIEGKTSGLTKSLQEANSSINKTTSALKDVDKALQLDPTNVELLAQKEALLAKQIEQTNEKLEIMKQVADDANEALARGDITQEQYAQLQAEIVKTESALSGLESEAEGSSDALEDTGDNAEEAGMDMEAFGEAAQKAGEIAVAAFEAVVVAAAAVGAAVVGAMVEAGTALANATINTAHLADEIATLSVQTGLSTDTIQELNYASELLDVSTETVTGSMTKLLRQCLHPMELKSLQNLVSLSLMSTETSEAQKRYSGKPLMFLVPMRTKPSVMLWLWKSLVSLQKSLTLLSRLVPRLLQILLMRLMKLAM